MFVQPSTRTIPRVLMVYVFVCSRVFSQLFPPNLIWGFALAAAVAITYSYWRQSSGGTLLYSVGGIHAYSNLAQELRWVSGRAGCLNGGIIQIGTLYIYGLLPFDGGIMLAIIH